jgi:predicted small secreted protein
LQARQIELSKKPMKRIFTLTVVAVTAVLFSSCNSMIGLGRDMRIGGEGLEKIANKSAGDSSSSDASGAPVY